MRSSLEHHQVRTNGIELHVVQGGHADGQLVLLLHGFPEFWLGWTEQIDALIDAGYRVWIPDQRGYNESDKPETVASYDIDQLVDDVRGLVEATGRERVMLVAHDWGGAVAWVFASRYPQLIGRLVILNCPHPDVMMRYIRSSPKQMLRSWYMLFFQIPRVPEALLRRNNFAALVGSLVKTSRRGSFPRPLLDQYRHAWAQPNALTSMINWYRALLRRPKPTTRTPRISVPTLLLWGKKDMALTSELAKPSIELCDRGEVTFFDDLGHWLLHEDPKLVNAAILDFLARKT